jgi:hypothetical protein
MIVQHHLVVHVNVQSDQTLAKCSRSGDWFAYRPGSRSHVELNRVDYLAVVDAIVRRIRRSYHVFFKVFSVNIVELDKLTKEGKKIW